MTMSILSVSIIAPLLLGIGINVFLYKIFKKNLFAFLLSLLGIPIVGEILKGIINSMLPKGSMSVGAALAGGIGASIAIIMGVICYTIASLGTSVYRWWNGRAKSNLS